MGIQLWKLNASISGNFFLVDEKKVNHTQRPHPSIRKFSLIPEFSDDGKQNGKFNVEIDFVINSDSGKTDYFPQDLGRNIFYFYICILSFLSGYPVRVLEKPYITYNYPGTNKYRRLFFSEEQKNLEAATPILNTSIFSIPMDSKNARILSWFKKGLEEEDLINSMLALYISLEILSNGFQCDGKTQKECSNCGYITEVDPGMRKKVENFLVNVIGYSNEQFKKIWNTRNEITHGGFDLNCEGERMLSSIRLDLTLAIIKGMKRLLNFSSDEPPREIPPIFSFCDPVLDVEYTIPEEK